jgi:hypothetical protein
MFLINRILTAEAEHRSIRRDLLGCTCVRQSPFTRPPGRRRIAGRNLSRSQRDKIAPLVGIAADLRTILAAHISFKLVDWRRLRPAHDVQRDRLVSVATDAPDLEITIAGVECVAQRGRGLCRPLVANMRWFPASQASLSASFRASLARSAEARLEAP